jgi:hypothetical protein
VAGDADVDQAGPSSRERCLQCGLEFVGFLDADTEQPGGAGERRRRRRR